MEGGINGSTRKGHIWFLTHVSTGCWLLWIVLGRQHDAEAYRTRQTLCVHCGGSKVLGMRLDCRCTVQPWWRRIYHWCVHPSSITDTRANLPYSWPISSITPLRDRFPSSKSKCNTSETTPANGSNSNPSGTLKPNMSSIASVMISHWQQLLTEIKKAHSTSDPRRKNRSGCVWLITSRCRCRWTRNMIRGSGISWDEVRECYERDACVYFEGEEWVGTSFVQIDHAVQLLSPIDLFWSTQLSYTWSFITFFPPSWPFPFQYVHISLTFFHPHVFHSNDHITELYFNLVILI